MNNKLSQNTQSLQTSVSGGYDIKLEWSDKRDVQRNPKPSYTSVQTVSEYSLNGMMLVEIYEGNGFFEIDGNYVPIQCFGGDYDSHKFKKIELAKKYVEKNVLKWLKG